MTLEIDPGWAISVYLLALRLGVLLIMIPIFSSLSGLVTVRILFTLALSAAVVSGTGLRTQNVPLEIGPIISASFVEVAIGGILAFGVFTAFGAFSVAGKILDVQSGFGIGSVFDPVTRAGAPLFSTLLNLLAVAVFFGMDGHHAFFRGVVLSVQAAPPGAGLSSVTPEAAVDQFGLMFSLGVALIAPTIFCLFLVEAALGIMSRVLPQMNVFVVGMPVKIFTALAVLAMTLGLVGPQMQRIYASIFTYWGKVLS